jgi:Leucine-rich repeat (LRR) protein
VSDAALAHLASFPSLEDLTLGNTRVSLAGYEQLKAAMPKCNISWSETNRLVAEKVLALGGTVEIGLEGQPARPVKAVEELPRELFQVRRVSLAGVTKPLDNLPDLLSWLRFHEFDRLEKLDLSGIKGLNYAFLAPIAGLEELSLANARLNDVSLGQLPKLPTLQRLVLDGNEIGGNGLAALSTQPALVDLSLANAGLNDVSLGQLPKLPTLRRLVLDGNDIRGNSLSALRDQPALVDLSVGCPTLTDLFAKNLAELKQLKRLSLAGSKIGDAGIKHLEGLTNLEALDLRQTNVTAAGIERLQKALPTCRIARDSPNE